MKKMHFYNLTGQAGFLFALLFTSCAPAYVPNVVNSPMFSNKGEVQVSGHGGIAGFDPQAAVAVTDHVGIMMNGSFENRTEDSTENYHKHNFIEFGAGYYQKIGVIGRFEAYGGGGFGKLQAYEDAGFWVSKSDVKTMRFFVQPAIGMATEVFDGSFAARLVALNLKQDTLSNTGVLIEPAFTFKVGYKFVKAVFQVGASLPLNGEHIDFTYQPFIYSVGLQVTLGRH
jgi:hypothetical protein